VLKALLVTMNSVAVNSNSGSGTETVRFYTNERNFKYGNFKY